MNFQEEYFKRHLMVAPVIKYVKEGYLILRHPQRISQPKWVVFQIKENAQSGHPNDVILTEFIPRYNGGTSSKGAMLQQSIPINFHTYYGSISDKIKMYTEKGYKPVFNMAETRIAVIEMFINAFCSYLLELYQDQIIKDYFGILDETKSMDEKMAFVDKIDGVFLESSSHAREQWQYFRRYSNPDLYCTWMKSWF